MNNRRNTRESFALPLPRVMFLGSVLAASFYGLIISGPLNIEILRRYCLSHAVAVASVSLFWIGLVGLCQKWFLTSRQSSHVGRAAAALKRLISEGEDVPVKDRSKWLAASWQSQPVRIRDSWFGARVQRILEMQINRGRQTQLETDLRQISDLDADRQHDSYGLLRIINWAMPMLGFLGTVLGISQTLGQLDTKLLATQQQEAMNQLTAGLYVAFDTTAIALSLTVFSMFVQFAVSRFELNLLNRIDSESSDCMITFLSSDPTGAEATLLEPVREMTRELVASVQDLVKEQAAIWSKSIAESQQQWSDWTERSALQAEKHLGKALLATASEHITGLEKIQSEGIRSIDLRWQQWQTTLSDQARTAQTQQAAITEQSKTLDQLVQSTSELRKLEDVIHDSVSRLENVGRIEEATLCVGEAVAVLAASLERAGVFRGAPTKPRPARRPETDADQQSTASTSEVGAAKLPDLASDSEQSTSTFTKILDSKLDQGRKAA